MAEFLDALAAVNAALPLFLDTFDAIMSLVEHVALRLVVLIFTFYGLYHAVVSHRP